MCIYFCIFVDIYIYVFMYLFTVIFGAVARDMLHVTRMIGGFVPCCSRQILKLVQLLLQSLSLLSHLFFSSLCFCVVVASGRAPGIGESFSEALESEGLPSGGHARVDSSSVVSLDGRSSGGRAGSPPPRKPQSSHRVEFDADEGSRAYGRDDSFRRRIPVADSPRRRSVRPLLTNERTPRCSARYGLRGDRVGEASHPGPQVSQGGVRRLVSSDDEPLVSVARNMVARVCTTQIDDESSRMIPSTVPATPVTLAGVTGERAPCPLDIIDALEDDFHCVERGHMDNPLVVQGDPCEDQSVRIDMTRGDEEESGEDRGQWRLNQTTLQVGCEGRSAVPVNSDHPAVWCWGVRGNERHRECLRSPTMTTSQCRRCPTVTI